MSHFAVAVISDGTKTVEELLAPYQENNVGCPKEYLKFYRGRDKEKENYETGTVEQVVLSDGSIHSLYDGALYKPITKNEYERCVKDDDKLTRTIGFGDNTEYFCCDLKELQAEKKNIPFKELYPTIEEYLEDYCDYEYDEDARDYGYWQNPNAKWDWYVIGGRFSGKLKARIGKHGSGSAFGENPRFDGEFDEAYISDIDFSIDQKQYDKSLRFWEVVIDEEPLRDGENAKDFYTFFTKDYYTHRYLNKETYAKIQASVGSYAVVTPDGEWHQKGEMGWFGMSSETDDESLDWDLHYKERFIDTAKPDWTITIVDCHI